jgi:hypothetical protein
MAGTTDSENVSGTSRTHRKLTKIVTRLSSSLSHVVTRELGDLSSAVDRERFDRLASELLLETLSVSKPKLFIALEQDTELLEQQVELLWSLCIQTQQQTSTQVSTSVEKVSFFGCVFCVFFVCVFFVCFCLCCFCLYFFAFVFFLENFSSFPKLHIITRSKSHPRCEHYCVWYD